MAKSKVVSILGCTGSVGLSTVDVILNNADLYTVDVVSAHKNVQGLADIARKTKARKAVIADESLHDALTELLSDTSIETAAGAQAVAHSVTASTDIVMAAIMGFAGLEPILHALRQGIDVAVANKEPLVAAGRLIMRTARDNNARILPVDSEHNAIFQVFENHNREAIKDIILTASGGPFLHTPRADMNAATPVQACKHPNWSMGQKISVDSATMMNKALEVIEAYHLFDVPAEMIKVVIHPQSVIHSMVQYKDGSTLSQMGASDMRTPIASALAYPDRLPYGGDDLDCEALPSLTFSPPDLTKFPALDYAYRVLDLGQGACITFNAANEVAVAYFLNEEIGFGDIMRVVQYAVDNVYPDIQDMPLKTVEHIIACDNAVRDHVKRFIHQSDFYKAL